MATEPRWRDAAIQAKDDLRAIEEAFRKATPVGEDGPNPPIGPGHVFAEWTSPALTMRWIEEMEAAGREAQQEPEGDGWEITDEDVRAGLAWSDSRPHGMDDATDCRHAMEFTRDRLRARVQPRRVSREEFEAVVKEIKTGYLTYADPDEVAVDVLDILGIEITPTEGDE